MPGGVFLFGNARDRAHDFRELFIVLDDPAWHYAVALHPDLGLQAREFAAAVRRAAAAMSVTAPPPSDHANVIDQLERLSVLRERGVLTDTEFEAQKQRILDA